MKPCSVKEDVEGGAEDFDSCIQDYPFVKVVVGRIVVLHTLNVSLKFSWAGNATGLLFFFFSFNL